MHWLLFPADSREVVCFYVFWTALAVAIWAGWVLYRRKPGEEIRSKVNAETTFLAVGFSNSLLTVVSPFSVTTFELISSDLPQVYAFAGFYGLLASLFAFVGRSS